MQYRKIEEKENMAGGKGTVTIRHILGDNELNGKCKLYAQVTIAPGAVLGVHPHHNETETYYILQGKGLYTDNGKEYEVKAGDITFCEDGSSHGLANTGSKELVFMALIINN